MYQYQERARERAGGESEGIFRQVRRLIAYREHSDERDGPVPPVLQSVSPFGVPVNAREWAGAHGRPPSSPEACCWPGAISSLPYALRLRAPDGSEVPFQFDVLRRDRRDGSVRSLWLTFQAPWLRESGRAIRWSRAPPRHRRRCFLLPPGRDEVFLHTGDLLARASGKEFSLLSRNHGGEIPSRQGARRDPPGAVGWNAPHLSRAPSQVVVERNGPLHAVVVVRGYPAPADGDVQQRFRYEARLRL